jgi:hypothetical protein
VSSTISYFVADAETKSVPVKQAEIELLELADDVAQHHSQYILTDESGTPQAMVVPMATTPKPTWRHRIWRGIQTGGVSCLYDD